MLRNIKFQLNRKQKKLRINGNNRQLKRNGIQTLPKSNSCEPPVSIKTMKLLFAAIGVLLSVEAIKFDIPVWASNQYEGKERCVSLFIPPHSLVSGAAEAGPAFHTTTQVKVNECLIL